MTMWCDVDDNERREAQRAASEMSRYHDWVDGRVARRCPEISFLRLRRAIAHRGALPARGGHGGANMRAHGFDAATTATVHMAAQCTISARLASGTPCSLKRGRLTPGRACRPARASSDWVRGSCAAAPRSRPSPTSCCTITSAGMGAGILTACGRGDTAWCARRQLSRTQSTPCPAPSGCAGNRSRAKRAARRFGTTPA